MYISLSLFYLAQNSFKVLTKALSVLSLEKLSLKPHAEVPLPQEEVPALVRELGLALLTLSVISLAVLLEVKVKLLSLHLEVDSTVNVLHYTSYSYSLEGRQGQGKERDPKFGAHFA